MIKINSQNYQDALDYIYSFVDFSRTHQDNLSPDNFDLRRMEKFLKLLKSPHRQFNSIHIAGSKGKGSVSAFCEAALQKAGYKVGLYTSPHLRDFEERIQVNRKPIPRQTIVAYIDEMKPAIETVADLTTFEIMTALAFLFFARTQVDLAVVEVGLGGRLDATNVITPLVSVITSLYLDHTSILGDTLVEIAAEKAGIIKPSIPVISAPQENEAWQVLTEVALKNRSPLIQIDKEYQYKITEKTLDGQLFDVYKSDDGAYSTQEYQIPLLGAYQVTNAVTAIACLDVLRKQGYPMDETDVKNGLSETKWLARFEILRKEPPLIVDAAHNPASIEKLIETVNEFFSDRPMILVFGISEDKQLDGMYQQILARTTHLICTQADHPRAMDPSLLAAKAEDYSPRVEVVPEVRNALEQALQLAGNTSLVLVTGSIFVAASARIAWFENGLSNEPVA